MPCGCGEGHLLHGLMVAIVRGFKQRATIGRPAFYQGAPGTAHRIQTKPGTGLMANLAMQRLPRAYIVRPQ
jgi:hypothetical protein